MDLEFSPNLLNTPSLMTPNIAADTPVMFKSSYAMAADDDNNNGTSRTARRLTDESSLVVSSADVKMLKIEHDLKQTLSQPRKPTESPFQKLAESGSFSMPKPVSMPLTNDDGIPLEIPSTAEVRRESFALYESLSFSPLLRTQVMNVIESFAKNLAKDNTEREAAAATITTTTTTSLLSENHRLDSSPTQAMGVNVSPKKKLLIRSQSHTEPSSPPLPQPSQTEESSIDEHRFQRLQDLPLNDSNTTQIDLHIKPAFPLQAAPIVITAKRTYNQAMIGNLPTGVPIPKNLIPVQHEVSSSGQLMPIKRQKTNVIPPTNNSNLRSSTNDDSFNPNDDQRKKQIRESNREAARRCRERRRNYIEQLEGNLEQCKLQMKQLNDKLSRAERENTQLRAIITEAKIFHPTGSSTRLSSSVANNESMMDFVNVISTTNGIDLNNETTDGTALTRSFIQRNSR